MRHFFATPIAAACLVLGAASAQANSVNLSGFTFGSASTVNASGAPAYSGGAGQFVGLLDGNSFATFCVELTQSFQFNVNYTDYSIVSGASYFTGSKAADLAKLVTAHAGSVVDASSSAAFQAAVWEIVYETGSYNLNAGTIQFAPGTVSAADLATANGWFATLNAVVPDVSINVLQSREHQDFLLAAAVPEPSTYALLAAGLLGVGFVARRRTHQR